MVGTSGVGGDSVKLINFRQNLIKFIYLGWSGLLLYLLYQPFDFAFELTHLS